MGELDEITQEVVRAVSALPQASGAVTAETNIVQDLGLDSLAVMNFVMALEDQFDVSIPIDKLTDIKTVGDLAAVIAELRRHQSET